MPCSKEDLESLVEEGLVDESGALDVEAVEEMVEAYLEVCSEVGCPNYDGDDLVAALACVVSFECAKELAALLRGKTGRW
ncbi:MAG: hypothetical protein QW067_09255 [Thermofilaceae archaeon]